MQRGDACERRWVAALLWGGLSFLALAVRMRVAASVPGSVDADESIIFLMANRIASGTDFPLLHYGNSHLGSADAILAAALMRSTGGAVLSGRLVSVLLSLVLVATAVAMGRAVAGRKAGWLTGFYVALGPGLLVTWGAKLHLGYLDIAILGNLFFLVCLQHQRQLDESRARPIAQAFAAGFVVGVGLWCHVLFLVYLATGVVFLTISGVRARRPPCSLRELLVAGGALCLGAAPLALCNLAHGARTAGFVARAGWSGDGPLERLVHGGYNLLVGVGPVVLGAAPSWDVFRPESAVRLPTPYVSVAEGVLLLVVALLWASIAGRLRRGAASWLPPIVLGRWGLVVAATLAAIALASLAATFSAGDIAAFRVPPRPESEIATLLLLAGEVSAPRMAVYPVLLAPAFAIWWHHRARLRTLPVPPDDDDCRDEARSAAVRLLWIHLAVAAAAYVFSSYCTVRSPRFLFPVYSAVPPLLALAAVRLDTIRRHVGTAWLVAVVIGQTVVQIAAPPAWALQPAHYVGRIAVADSYQPLVELFDRLRLRRAYSPYWTGTPLIFASGDRIAVSTGTPGRLPLLDREVELSDRVAFVFYRGRPEEAAFSLLLARAGTEPKVDTCGPFRVYSEVPISRLRSSPAWPKVVTVLGWP